MAEASETSRQQLISENKFGFILLVAGSLLLLDLIRRLWTGDVATGRLATFLWNGFVFGVGIGLAGIGLAMTYSILSFANFAHGDLLTTGAFMGWVVTFVLAGFADYALKALVLLGGPISIAVADIGISVTQTPLAIVAGLLVAMVSTAGLALFIDRIVFRPMRDQSGVALLIASVGVALTLRHVLLIVFQGGTRGLTAGQRTPSWTVPVGNGSVNIGAHEVTLIVLAASLMLATHVLLQYTKLGTAMRAMADNENLALVTGIPTERIVLYTWLIGGALTGAAGFLFALEQGNVNTTFGWDLLLVIFAAVILGGIGSVYGAIAGGLIIGIASRLALIWLPEEFFLAAAFLVMILILLVRPKGLLGGVTSV